MHSQLSSGRNGGEVVKGQTAFSVAWPIIWRYSQPSSNFKSITRPKHPETKSDPVYSKSRLQKVDLTQKKNTLNGNNSKCKLNQVTTSKMQSRSCNLSDFNTRFITSSKFLSCGTQWYVVLRLSDDQESDYEDPYISAHLVSLAEIPVTASYTITIKDQLSVARGNSVGSNDCVWNDPDSPVVFSEMSEGDNEWGTEEFINMAVLLNEDEDEHKQRRFTLDGHLHFMVDIEVHREESFSYRATSSTALDDSSDEEGKEDGVSSAQASSASNAAAAAGLEQDELIDRAKEEVSAVLRQLSKGRDVDEQKYQEDRIVRSRLQSTVSTTTNISHVVRK